MVVGGLPLIGLVLIGAVLIDVVWALVVGCLLWLFSRSEYGLELVGMGM